MPVRKVVTRGHKGMRCLAPSLKMKRMIGCESILEADAVLLFERTADIVGFEEQPCIEYPYADGMPFKYIPDFLVWMRDGSQTYVEIKPSKRLERPKLQKRLNCVAEHFQRTGRNFKILTELDIRKGHTHSNGREIFYHARDLPTSLEFKERVENIKRLAPITFEAACNIIGERRLVFQLIASSCLVFDAHTQLDDNTLLFCSEEGRHHATFQI